MTVFAGLLGLFLVITYLCHSSFIFWHHAALLICLENSFWYQSTLSSFMDAFGKAFGFYKESGTQERVEIALKEVANCSEEKPFKAALSELLLKHHLCVLNYIFSCQLNHF